GRLSRTASGRPQGSAEARRFRRACSQFDGRPHPITGHLQRSGPSGTGGAAVAVQIPRAVQARYGNCPTPTTATNAIANNITGPGGGSTEFSNCVQLRQGPSPVVNIPPGLDIEHLAQIGLEVAGMNSTQSQDFLKTVDWKSTLSMTMPRFLRPYQG